MTGDQHYREAERLLDLANGVATGFGDDVRGVLAEAQVHATLAYAAAKATGLNLPGYGSERGAR
jgi:hypothetical protein